MRKELRHERTLVNRWVARSKRPQIREQDRQEENDQHMDLIHAEYHFNFIKMHLISHFCDHICQFGNIPMFLPIMESSPQGANQGGISTFKYNRRSATDPKKLESTTCNPDETFELRILAPCWSRSPVGGIRIFSENEDRASSTRLL